MKVVILLAAMMGFAAYAEEAEENSLPVSSAIEGGMSHDPSADGLLEPVAESASGTSRDPAAQEAVPGRKVNEDELRVRSKLPEAPLRKDARSVQAEVYKTIYNRDLKPDQREDVLDE